jgi:hypothetical protein
VPPEIALELFFVANRFMIEPLQKVAENVIKNNLDVDNVCEILEEVVDIEPRFQSMCETFALEHWDEIIQTEGYKKMGPLAKKSLDNYYNNQSQST